jgi:hypothetical protein
MEVIPLYGLLVDFSQSVALPCLSSSLFSEWTICGRLV